MDTKRQVFQTRTNRRWSTIKWLLRLLVVVFILLIPARWLTLQFSPKPTPVVLKSEADTLSTLSKLLQTETPENFEKHPYKGFDEYLKKRQLNDKLTLATHKNPHQKIRAAFFINRDPQSLYSLQENISKLNMVLPGWFFIDAVADTLIANIDADAYATMKKHPISIVPSLTNVSRHSPGRFDGAAINRILNNEQKKQRLINDIANYIERYHLQGINIDFENMPDGSEESVIAFQNELYQLLHSKGKLVTREIKPSSENYNYPALNKYADYLFVAAYNKYFNSAVAAPVSDRSLQQTTLKEVAKKIPASKIILCLAGYGADWTENSSSTQISYQQALTTAVENFAAIQFDSLTYNCSYIYKGSNGKKHQVFFTDAVGIFNSMRFAETCGTAGTALWQLGSEDERLWQFYDRDLSDSSLVRDPFDYVKLATTQITTGKPDYIGDGEILNVMSGPKPGRMELTVNKNKHLISGEKYLQLPSRYVIKKYGNVKKQVVLSFDDGPDAAYTPAILDILKKENVPACFFVVGANAEANLSLLRRIYNEGHEIGNHSFTHPNIATISAEQAQNELDATRLLIESVTGHSTILFRAPYNADYEPTKAEELKPVALSREDNYYTVVESIDPGDGQKGITADDIYKRTIALYEKDPSKGVILLHDAGGNRQATVDALPRIIDYFKKNDIGFTTVANLLHKKKDEVMPIANNRLGTQNNNPATSIFYVQYFLEWIFWLVIILSALRMLLFVSLSTLHFFRARKMALRIATGQSNLPEVSVIIPAYNDALNTLKTVKNVLAQDYPNFNVIVVDDGSEDNTYKRLQAVFKSNDHVTVVTKSNEGKASAINWGINIATTEYVVCVDSGIQLKANAISHLMHCFFPVDGSALASQKIAAVAGNIKLANENNLLSKLQSNEYTQQNFERVAFDTVNAATLADGAIAAFRKDVIEEVGGFTIDTLTTACDISIRMQQAGYIVKNCPDAIAIINGPVTLDAFLEQQLRWSQGIAQTCIKHQAACFNPAYKRFGMLALPNLLLFQFLLPILAPVVDLALIFGMAINYNAPQVIAATLVFYCIFLLVDASVSIMAISNEKQRLKKLLWLIPQRFVHRQMMYLILIKALGNAFKHEHEDMQTVNETGDARQFSTTGFDHSHSS